MSAARQTPLGRATIGDQLRRHARTQPRKVAFVTYAPDRAELTYAELDALANRWAHLLAAHGVGRGHVVAMLARNGIPTVAAYYGALKLGAALRTMAQESRDIRMAAAEAKAAALPPKLTVPMILFFLPVLFVVILGPTGIKVAAMQ